MQNKQSAEEMLDKIFTIMQQLLREMRQNENRDSDHLKVFHIFSELGRTLVDADRASFWKWDKERHRLVTAAATGIKQIEIGDTDGLVGHALSINQPVVVNDPYHHPQFNVEVDRQTGYRTDSVLVLPVSNCRGEIIGAFQAINKLSQNHCFDETEDVKRLSIAAFICGMALESDLFMQDAQHDKLTGINNRFGFYGDWKTRYRPMLYGMVPATLIGIVLCDIDFFKKVNDIYGHNAGDAVLVMVANTLKAELRKNDNVYRWGGEEFIIVLEDATISVTAEIAERIRQRISQSVCAFEGQDIKVTMSFGCVAFDKQQSMDENIGIADARLYRAKETGRNRVVATDNSAERI